MAGVLVICESKQGRLQKTSRQVLSAGRRLAEASGEALVAAAFGPDAASLAGDAGSLGAATILVVADPALGEYSTEAHTAAAVRLIEHADPSIVLLPGSSNGRDLAPRLAARLGVGVASDVTGLEWVEGKLRARRPVYSGKAIAVVEVDGRPAIATCRPNAFPIEPAGGSAAEVVSVDHQASQPRARVVETKIPESEELTIAEADIIVSGGRGLKEAANFSYIRDLAHAIGGAVGASRATVDAGWIDHHHQVGQTGRVVSPNVYIAVGVSGAIQHLAGMSSSKHIVAINKDAEAPIFRIADLGVVGDLFQILPLLTEEVKKAKEQH
ncbi:MAG TPA: electron transfer flavoprotein subunit alpha/FixB family protein [Thermoanaerobaculia bacterium]|nr:electron transfer flavoprotein subunit alpha/FixB family protein [Thermoanaerobaculia bacterium]